MLGNASATAAILAAVWSKTSFGMTLLRITDGKMKPVIWVIVVSMDLFMGVHGLMPWIQCNPVSKTWNRDDPGECWNPQVNIVYGVVAGCYSGLMDIVLALLPWSIVLQVQMKKKQIGVTVAMSMGVFAGCTASVKSAELPLLAHGDFTFEGYNLVPWGAAGVATTIMAASIPTIRVLVREVKATTCRLYGSSSDDTYHKKSYGAGSLARSNTLVVATCQKRLPLETITKPFRRPRSDDWSDKTCWLMRLASARSHRPESSISSIDEGSEMDGVRDNRV